jgi:hypothetical protein
MSQAAETQIRNALSSGEFTRAQALWDEHAGRLRAAAKDGSLTGEDVAGAGRLVEWARLVVDCFRAEGAVCLGELRAAAAYRDAPPRRRRSRGVYG